MNSGLQGLLNALEKPKSHPVDQVLFYSGDIYIYIYITL